MTTLTVRVSEEAAKRLEARAKRLGTTIEEVAATVLEEKLARRPTGEGENARKAAGSTEIDEDEEPREGDTMPGAPHVVFRRGFWVITGELPPGDSWPDHRALREEHLDEVMKAALGAHRR